MTPTFALTLLLAIFGACVILGLAAFGVISILSDLDDTYSYEGWRRRMRNQQSHVQ